MENEDLSKIHIRSFKVNKRRLNSKLRSFKWLTDRIRDEMDLVVEQVEEMH